MNPKPLPELLTLKVRNREPNRRASMERALAECGWTRLKGGVWIKTAPRKEHR